MKKPIIFLLFFVFLVNQGINSQFKEAPIINLENIDKSLLNWGFFLGINQYGFKFDYKKNAPDILTEKRIGFNLGIIGELRVNRFLDLRLEPGFFYTKRELHWKGFTEESDSVRDVPSSYIKFPLLLKVSTLRIGNWKPYIIGGVSATINLAANENNTDDNSKGNFRMKKNGLFYELGLGIDFYLFYFKFSPSIRGVFAITDELVPDNNPLSPWTGNINSLQTRGVFINFTFE